ncbi:alpha/beta hydrolase fold domain-containing protein [Brevibacterium sp. 5221]|uniref:Alpha/beta hydrolase fold domain-containing protein n=1 Tax=Brevibacterium rongguiense TaxID=2695267 RepID=A0A6N9HAX4_9MICO|nr:alpha/beta hydrolase [Brevibacterium rongguiense]MYM20644.1 alpha/beta hydrolase fold domain-containing protein [Brevibacterium rongguiense]
MTGAAPAPRGAEPHTAAFSPEHPDLLLDLVTPPGPPPSAGWPVIVWLHGGGWRLQDRTARPDFDAHFAARGFAMASIDYRLAPRWRHPAQVCDLRRALRWLRAQAGRLRLDPARIGLWGSSAGGHVAAFTALSAAAPRAGAQQCPAQDDPADTSVACAVVGYPPSLIDELLGPWAPGRPHQRTSPEEDLLGGPATSAAEHAALLQRGRLASPARLEPQRRPPPFFILHGTADALVPPEQSRALHEHLAAAGGHSLLYLVEGFGHGFLNPGTVEELGPGIRLDNGRLAAEPEAEFRAERRGGFDPQGRPASFELIGDFFAHHLQRA